jgi:hypothetical protein
LLLLQVAHLIEVAKAAWATRNSEEAVALECAADEKQKEAIIIAKSAESSWKQAQDIEAEANRLSLSVQVRAFCCLYGNLKTYLLATEMCRTPRNKTAKEQQRSALAAPCPESLLHQLFKDGRAKHCCSRTASKVHYKCRQIKRRHRGCTMQVHVHQRHKLQWSWQPSMLMKWLLRVLPLPLHRLRWKRTPRSAAFHAHVLIDPIPKQACWLF